MPGGEILETARGNVMRQGHLICRQQYVRLLPPSIRLLSGPVFVLAHANVC